MVGGIFEILGQQINLSNVVVTVVSSTNYSASISYTTYSATIVVDLDIESSVNNGLINYYRLDSNANDSKGTNNGTATNVSWINGKLSQCGSFNGVDSRIIAQPISQISKVLPYSISLWFQSAGTQSTNQSPLLINTIASNDRNGICMATNGTQVNTGHYNGSSYFVKKSKSGLSFNTWYHLVVTFDGSTDYHLYIDAVEATGTTQPSINGGASLAIGSDVLVSVGDRKLNGYLDDIRVYNRVLSTTEITNLYNFGIAKSYLVDLNNVSVSLSYNNYSGTLSQSIYSCEIEQNLEA